MFTEFAYRTRKSWAYERRVIAKAEWTQGAANPRFIVTNVHPALGAPQFLYETVYCARGEMENRLKECQGDLFADRTPTPTMRSNQLRLWLSSLAYVLMCAVRRIGLAGDQARSGDLRHDPAEAPQARSPRHDLGSARQARLRVQLSGRAGVRHGSPTIVRLSGGDRFTARGSTKEDQRQSDRLPDRRQ